MVTSVFSPCLPAEVSVKAGYQCYGRLVGVVCSPRQRVRCSKFLDYIGKLNNNRLHNILINELRELIKK